ncbi:hypothetical protein EXU57_14935 [Segetibacter sp. 3557_3]|uniref:heavy metal-binding domain-containing protein n=1 Tax=Segetibacter sp. 3557_3 TaxID=2547429 RepID=UPI001058DF2C|nr:heavy metal-binding domain-containing protein [Segetibacter sp. 3557_3]TDH24629.1 hypothetical protein EXU57_14935 [Segetibacter sp. 3557_3]
MKIVVMCFAVLMAVSHTTFAQAKQKAPKENKESKSPTKYTCEMDPDVVKSKPGKCTKCGMTLVAVKTKKAAEKTAPKM